MKKLKMYALSTCPWCKKAKKYFERKGVTYDYTDYDLADQKTQKRIERDMRKVGADGFPLVKLGKEIVQGYYPERYKELLRQTSRPDAS